MTEVMPGMSQMTASPPWAGFRCIFRPLVVFGSSAEPRNATNTRRIALKCLLRAIYSPKVLFPFRDVFSRLCYDASRNRSLAIDQASAQEARSTSQVSWQLRMALFLPQSGASGFYSSGHATPASCWKKSSAEIAVFAIQGAVALEWFRHVCFHIPHQRV